MHLTIYTQPNCTYCDQAKALMKAKKVTFNEVNLNVGQKQVEGATYMPITAFREKFPKARTMPQITEGNTLIGGFAELEKFLRYD